MPVRCVPFTPTRFERLRFTISDNCGREVYGPTSTWVTGTPMSVQLTRNQSESEATTKTLPDGTICWSLPGQTQTLNHTLTLAYCEIDPALMVALNSGNSPVHNYLFDTVGWDETNGTSVYRAAVEGWMTRPIRSGSSACDDPDSPAEGEWSYVGAFNVSGFASAGDTTYGTEAPDFTITATVNSGARWGRGPYPIQLNPGAPARPGPFVTPVNPATSIRYATLDVAPPEVTCGPRPLSNPAAPLMFIQRGDNNMMACVQVLADGGTWVVDFGDGSPTQQFSADEEVCYQYTEEGCYNVGIWQEGNPRMYRGEHLCLPQTLALVIEPTSGAVPLDVVATISGATGQPTMEWGD